MQNTGQHVPWLFILPKPVLDNKLDPFTKSIQTRIRSTFGQGNHPSSQDINKCSDTYKRDDREKKPPRKSQDYCVGGRNEYIFHFFSFLKNYFIYIIESKSKRFRLP